MTKKRSDVRGDRIEAHIGNNVSHVNVGKNIHQTTTQHASHEITSIDIANIRELFVQLTDAIEVDAPPDKREAAKERIQELEKELVSQKPDITTMEYVKKWFETNIPTLAGAVISVIVHPLVGKVVEASGDIVVAEFRRRLSKD
jgi:hypothetical protein